MCGAILRRSIMIKKRTLALLLSLAMLLTFMPAMAFAEDDAGEAYDQVETAATEEASAEEAIVEEPAVEEAAAEDMATEETVEAEEVLNMEAAEPVPVSLKYSGPEVFYEPLDGPGGVDVYQEGMKFTITYSDDTTKTAECITWKTDKDEEGDTYTVNDYFFEQPVVKKDEDGDEYAENAIWFDFDKENATATSIPVSYEYEADKYVKGTLPITKKEYPKPVKVEFVPAGDFVAMGLIGDSYMDVSAFYGEGNKFVVTYDEKGKELVREFVFSEGEEYDAFRDADDEFWTGINLNKKIVKGVADYTGTANFDSEYGEVNLPVTVRVSAEMYSANVEFKTYSYTGKNIKPKVVVKYFDGKKFKKMSAKWYTCKPKKRKAIGGYEFEVKIKKKYQAKFGTSLWGYWEILPKTPTLNIKKTKAGAAGSGSMTVVWSKFSKKNQKGIDGFYIQIGDEKTFVYGVREVEAKKGDSKAVINDLDPGTYYVRILSHKAVGGSDGSPWLSKPSKVKTVVIN